MTYPKSEISLLGSLLKHAGRSRPIIIPIMLLGIFSAIVEFSAMTSIVPLGILAGGRPLPPQSTWNKLPGFFSVVPSARFFVTFFLSLLLLRMITYMATQVLNAYAVQTLTAQWSARAHATFVRHLHFRDIIKHQVGHFFTLAGDETNRGGQIVLSVMKLVPVAFLFVLYVGIILYQSWKGGLAFFILIIVMTLSLKSAFRKSLILGRRQQDESRAVNTEFFDSLGSLRTIRGFNAEDFIISRYTNGIHRYGRTSFLNEALSQLTQAPAIIVVALALCLVAFFADDYWLMQSMPLLIAGLMMFTRLLPVANQGLEAAMRLTANLKAGRNVAEMLQAVQIAEEVEPFPPFPAHENIHVIEFENVSFRYSVDTPKILDKFSYSLKAGRSYAITGPSGTGKSSLIDLLLKFYEPDCGTIRVNGQDIAKLSPASVRQHIVLAEQATRIFSGTVMENVQFGKGHSRGEAMQALKVVGLNELLDSLPEGLDTTLAFQGSNFSGGQRQRVGLARALVRIADVLILDESTNALDAATRQRIMDTLLDVYRDKILVFVAHDPYVTSRVDEVIQLRTTSQALDARETICVD